MHVLNIHHSTSQNHMGKWEKN